MHERREPAREHVSRTAGHRRSVRRQPSTPAPEKPVTEELPPGRYVYGELPGWFEDVDEDSMRGQPTFGHKGAGGLGMGPNYPITDSPTASYPRTRPFPEYGEGVHHSLIGKGPKGYKRSDERIHEDVCDCLTDAPLDASDVEVNVKSGIVTLSGIVHDKYAQRLAEDVVEHLRGVKGVENHLSLKRKKHA